MSGEGEEPETDPIAGMRAEVAAMKQIIDVLEPLKPVERLRVLSGVAAHFGFYEVAIEALKAAGRLEGQRL